MNKTLNETIGKSTLLAAALLTFGAAARAQVASNPPYAIEQSVIAGGGGTGTGAGSTFSITGAIGQAITDTSAAGSFNIKSGFFTAPPSPLAPTAALVTVGGRVVTATGRGIRNVRVSMTDASGATRTAVSGASGRFRFTDIAVGETYVFTAKGKRYDFSEPTQILSVTDEGARVNFAAVPR